MSSVAGFIAEIEKHRRALSAVGNKPVESAKTRGGLRDLAAKFFTDIRPSLGSSSADEQRISAINNSMQCLVELSHKRASAGKFAEILKGIKKDLIHLDGALISSPAASSIGQEKSEADVRIITTLRALVPSAALSYEQALLDLAQPERLSWRGPATDLREALRETLDRLAPDDEVRAMPGYKEEPDARGPTMKQKVRFILRNRQAGKAAIATTEDATRSVDEAVGLFVRSVYTRSSVSTHTPTEKGEVLRVLDLVRVVLAELLEAR